MVIRSPNKKTFCSFQSEEQFFVPTLRIQVTGKTKIRRLRREIYARGKTFAALMRRRERK
jgi:hypothetical protein